jgi:hypothetical protein
MLDGFLYSSNADQKLETGEIWIGWDFASTEGFIGTITNKLIYDHLTEDFHLSEEDSVLAGSYTFYNLMTYFSTPRGKTYSIGTENEIGPYYDGWLTSLSLIQRWIIRNRVELDGTYQYSRIDFPDRDQVFEAHIFRLNTLLTLGTKLSIAAFVQYNSSIDAVLANIRLRYNPREGNDFYIVYNEGYHTDRYREVPVFPISSNRTLMVKYTYTFIL